MAIAGDSVNATADNHGNVIREGNCYVIVVSGVVCPGSLGLEPFEAWKLPLIYKSLDITGSSTVNADLDDILRLFSSCRCQHSDKEGAANQYDNSSSE
jgi:hypothetical protein